MLKRALSLLTLTSLLLFTGLGCKSKTPAVPASQLQPVTLQYWGVFTDSDHMDILISAFQKQHPNISIQYRKFRPEEYENQLMQAFAEDRGPDLFTIHNSWLGAYRGRLAPMPDKITYPVYTKQGSGLSEKTTVSSQTRPGMTLKQLRDQFVRVVESDGMAFASNTSTQKSIFALPFYVDTLALYWNRDFLAQNGVTAAAKDWGTIRTQAEKLTKISAEDNKITQSIIAMGTGSNVHRAGDIVLALMMQNGAQLTNDNGSATFAVPSANQDPQEESPAAAALHFYLDFGNPDKKAYTWNTDMGDALQAFAQGRVGYYLGYSYDRATIQALNPRLNFDVSPLPTPRAGDTPMNLANYWMEAVSKKSANASAAWLFIVESATNKEVLTKYLAATKRAAALNEIIQTQQEDIDMGAFARQNLTARSWYRGKKSGAADAILVDMIDEARVQLRNPDPTLSESEIYQKSVNRAQARVNDTL